ncbi:MAG: endo alpha-1,4 polygalactosaminidase [Actinomycetota bacterium]
MTRAVRGALVIAAAALAVAVAVAALPSADARTPAAKLRGVRTWAFAIGTTPTPARVPRLARYDLVVVDGEEVTPGVVRDLHRRGTRVLAYLSVGTIEKGRSWSADLAPYRLDLWPEWDEWYADTSRPGFRDAITRRIAPRILAKGVDGLFLDNVDMVESHPKQAAGMRTLVAALARLVHRRGGVLFAQNGEDTIGPLLRHLDGWNREDVTSTHDGDYTRTSDADRSAAVAALRRIRRAGLLVTATDYVADGDAAGTADAVRTACAAGALPFVSDIDLTRIPKPIRCP